MKKLFLASFFALLSICANAYDFEADGICYNITGDNTVEVTSNSNGEYAGDIVIPNTVIYDSKEYGVTSIGDAAFYGCSGLTSIIVASGNSVYDSRNNCNAIIKTSDNSLVSGCKNTVIPASVTSIGDYAFYNCSGLITIDIPEGVTSIGNCAFSCCSGLTAIDIPEGVASIGKGAFSGCSGLTTIDIPASVTSIDDNSFLGCSGLTMIDIPKGVTSIGSQAFSDCNGLTAIDIPEGVTSIGNYAFQGCSGLTAIDIPASVTSIGEGVFWGCSGLTAIDIPEGVTSIGELTFAWCCGLTSIVVASGNSVYDSRNNCNAIIKTSDNSLVSGCKNTVIPASVTSIGNYAFSHCSDLTAISIPEGVTSIGVYAFWNCSGLTAIDIPASVTSIEHYAFFLCSSLTAINMSEGVTSIGNGAFSDCSGLTAINIPASVTSIGIYAFGNCNSLADIYCYGSTPAESDNLYLIFSKDTYSGCTLHVPHGTMNAYRAADNWKYFTNIVEFDPTDVETVSADRKSTVEQRIYNLGGVRMAAPQRGLNIINGKKVMY